MSGILRWLDDWAEEFCVSVMLALLVLLLGMEVFSRFLLGKSFSWMEELCRYLFVWSSYIGVAIAVKHKEQLRILMFMDVLKKRFPQLVRILYVVSELTFTVFCALVFYYSLGMLENMIRFKQVSASPSFGRFRACTAISGTTRLSSKAGRTNPCCSSYPSSSSCCLACPCLG